jgi:hypothetical protein
MTTVIEGRCSRKLNNSLTLTFQNGPGDPIAVAQQGAGDGKGRKAAVLFGFINGGTGRHVVTYPDGQSITVESREQVPTTITRGDGVALAAVERGDESIARLSGGTEILRVESAPEDAKLLEAFRMAVKAADGSELGRLDLIRTVAGWSLSQALWNEYIWWDHAGQPLKIPFLGARLYLTREITDVERDVLLAICVDLAIGLRPYIKEMRLGYKPPATTT